MIPERGLRRILETCLYINDMERSRQFYEGILGLEPHFADERMTGYQVGDAMLLLFIAGGTLDPVDMPFGTIPPHDAKGPMHFAFSIGAGSEQAWISHLEESAVAVESTVSWPDSQAVSVYFRDPDGHLVELATPGLWGIA
jgi:catechol 2,3-dioxygenase-like lactoylglutathione lyase family enzyme